MSKMRTASSRRRRGVVAAVLLATALVAVAAGVAQSATSKSAAKSTKTASVPLAPAFTGAQLAAPSSGWSTNGGSTMNQRYSPLTQINAGNVSKLKGIWETHLGGLGKAAKYSGEGQPIYWKGVLYVTTGNDDVSAMSVKTGKIIWTHKSNISQKISTVCCGWLNRGVAIGNGLVYLGQLDGKVVALSQATGEMVWTKQLVQWQKGATITGAPLFMGGKLYIGVVGADFGFRAFLQQMDAKTGKLGWRFYTIPGPKDPGGNTWPQGTNAYLRGGAAVWSTPAVDMKLGLMYLTTGNAGNDWYGGDRKGKNLYASSIIALHLSTGKVAWYFQEVHHDIWDYDTPSPPVLFDTTTAAGKKVQGIGDPGKTGWLYLLDRTNGKPLYGIKETKVPQNAAQKTWPTQPIPANAAFIRHGAPSKADIARVLKERTPALKKVPVVIAKNIFTPPPPGKLLIYGPGPSGGNNWMPSSYNQKTHMFYVCSVNTFVGVESANLAFKVGQSFAGIGGVAGSGFSEGTGTFTAIDAASGKVMWQKQWAEPCYSGTSTTAGNLVFVGRNDGKYQAYNATTGKLAWSFQTDAGANDVGTIFQDNGQEKIALLDFGNSLMATPHGDGVWLFGLNGTKGPTKLATAGAGTQHAGETNGTTGGGAGNATAGKAVFSANCAGCHGITGHGGNGGPDLTTQPLAKTSAGVVKQVTNGGGGMPAFKGSLSAKQIRDVAAYVTKSITKTNK
jgi:alcohol dehydrogenase (cytochrome c)